MRVCHSLIFFFLTLRDGGAALFEKDIGVRTGTEGGTITVKCTFSVSGSRKIFCRGDCEDGDILVETSGDSNQRGRYSIEYVEGSLTTFPLIYVSITNLKKSDSGRYRCELGRNWSPDASETFELRVKDAQTTTKPNWTLKPSTAESSSASPQTETPSTTAAAPAEASSGSVLFVRLVLVVVVIVLSSAVLVFCRRRRRRKPGDPHVELDYVNIPESDQVYEEVREEERRSRSPPEETASL